MLGTTEGILCVKLFGGWGFSEGSILYDSINHYINI